jgi:hypothetical protein
MTTTTLQHWCALRTHVDAGGLFSIAAVTFSSPTEIVDEYFARMPNEALGNVEPSWARVILNALAREPPTHRSAEVMIKDFALWYLKQNRRPTQWLVCDGHLSDGWLMREMVRLGVVAERELPASSVFDVGTLLAALGSRGIATYNKEKKLPVLVKDLDVLHPISLAVSIGQAYFETRRDMAVLLAYSKMGNGSGELPTPLIDLDTIDGVGVDDLTPSPHAKKRTDIEVGAPPTTPLEPEVKTERMSPPPPRQPMDKKTENDNDAFDEDADIDDKKGSICLV